MATELYTGVYGCRHIIYTVKCHFVKKVSLTLDFMYITHVNCHKTHNSYRNHATQNEPSVASADFSEYFSFIAGQKMLTPLMLDDLDLKNIYN